MDPMRFLESEDPVEVAIMWAIQKHWQKRTTELAEQQAAAIVNKLGEALKK